MSNSESRVFSGELTSWTKHFNIMFFKLKLFSLSTSALLYEMCFSDDWTRDAKCKYI